MIDFFKNAYERYVEPASLLVVIFLVLTVLSCSQEDEQACVEAELLEPATIEVNQCLKINDINYPDLEYEILGFENYVKRDGFRPQVWFSHRLTFQKSSATNYRSQIGSNPNSDELIFDGRVTISILNPEYKNSNICFSIYFDNVEFTETETEFIFHRATVRVARRDPCSIFSTLPDSGNVLNL